MGTCTVTPRVEALRRRVLDMDPGHPFGKTIADAEWWEQTRDEPAWLVRRAHRVAHTLRTLPLEVWPEELIVGRPDFRDPTPAEQERLAWAQEVCKQIPPHPGGDTGHFQADHAKLLRVGIGGLQREVAERQAGIQPDDPQADAKDTFYRACQIALDGFADLVHRVADTCQAQADGLAAEDPNRASMAELAAMCRRLAHEPAETFHEAVQLIHLCIIALWFGEDHGLNVPGRLDRTLWPYYQADLAAGRITPDRAQELIDCLYLQINTYCPKCLAVSVLVGGTDGEGRDVTNDLSALCIRAVEHTRLAYPTVGICWHEGTPEDLLAYGCQVIRTGLGSPAVFSDRVITTALRERGFAPDDACQFINSTCVEITTAGNSNIWVASPYYNTPGVLREIMDHVAAGTLAEPAGFDDLLAMYKQRLADRVAGSARDLDATWGARAERGGQPLQSCLMDDCLARGLDFDAGGARYNGVECSFVGLANLVDGLTAIRELVYEQRRFTLAEFAAILQADFDGHEPLRQEILNHLPKYGNDERAIDELAAELVGHFGNCCSAQRIGQANHAYYPGMFCWIMHGRLGAETGATPDGRRAGQAFADGAGPAQGRERRGPTAAIRSTTRWDHGPMLGGLVLNLKFSRSALAGETALRRLAELIKTYMRLGGAEVQVNVVDGETLQAARDQPAEHRDLLVRVAGYSDYFVNLDPVLQDEVIARTEYADV